MPDILKAEDMRNLEVNIDGFRYRIGSKTVQRAIMLADKDLSAVDPKNDHVIYPVAYAM